MFGASLLGHAVLFAAVLLVPASWMGAQRAGTRIGDDGEPGRAAGPAERRARSPRARRPVQESPPPTARPEPVRPPAAATPEMVEPVKARRRRRRRKAPPKVEPPREPTARTTPSTGDQVRQGAGGGRNARPGLQCRADLGRRRAPACGSTSPTSAARSTCDDADPHPERVGEPAAVARHHHRHFVDPTRRDDDRRRGRTVDGQRHPRPDRHSRRPAGAAVAAAAGGVHRTRR